ncbi:MAG: NYN domain-containing protein [Candidatus Aminicenantes bacterium]|nr:NYN domain-containing protein [Candidatus Aminicenantes bacterium]
MPYLIDGNNIIGFAADLDLRDPRSRDGLILKLLAFQRVTRKRIRLVFDGPAEGEPAVLAVNDKFTVHHPSPGESADDVLEAMMAGGVDRRQTVVVSSDRGLRDFARARGLRTLTAPEFNREVRAALRERRTAREFEKHDRPPSPLETKLWDEVLRSKS